MNDMTTNINEQYPPLQGDPARQAVDTWRGYVYQIWQSVYAWVTLDYDAALYLEGAEDFDTVSRKLTEAVQVKATAENITLNSDNVFEAISHYWQIQEKHPDRIISFRFLTLSNIGLEAGSPFGQNVKGLELWQRCSEDAQALQKLRHFLLYEWEGFRLTTQILTKLKKNGLPDGICQKLKPLVKKKQQKFLTKRDFFQEIETQIGKQQADANKNLILAHAEAIRLLPSSLKKFLSQADDQTFLEQLLKPIKWETGSKSAEYIEKEIERKLIRYGHETHNYPPSDSIKVVDRLLRKAIETVCIKEQAQRILTREDFELIFDKETKRSISYEEHRQNQELLKRIAFQTADFLPTNLYPQNTSLSIKENYFFHKGIPSLPKNVFTRSHLVDELNTYLNQTDFLVLTGSSGMGKTTLAKMICQVNDENWYWLDLSGRISEQIAFIFHHLASFIDQRREKINLVLDAVDLSAADFQKHEDYLGGLLYALSEVHGKIIITRQKPLPQRFLRNLGIHPLSICSIPRFEEEEILKFALQLGCSDKQIAINWAKIIVIQTQGHPQLVHARLNHLVRMKWPKPDIEALLTTPPEVVQEQTEIKVLFSQQLHSEQQELLYRLSAIHGKFKRDHVLNIGNIAIDELHPALRYPGNIFDQLVGPWIETFNEGYYQVSPLLKDAVERDWPERPIKILHAAIGQMFIQTSPFTNIEAANAFFHAWLSRSIKTLAPLLQSLLTAPHEAWKYVAHDLSWFLYIGNNPEKPLFPDEIWLNGMLRLLQFEIAIEVSPEKASLIADIWDRETVQSFLIERYMLASKILIRTQVQIPPQRLLNFLVEITEIYEQSEEVRRMSSAFNSSRWDLFENDLVSVFFSFIVSRCTNMHFLEMLLDGLKDIPQTIRERMFAIFTIPGSYEKILTNSVWMHEADSENPQWLEGIRVLSKMIELATRWNVPALIFEAARAIAIIYDEYLHDSSKALAILDDIAVKIGSSSNMLDYARAQIFFNHKKYSDALSVLEPLLPGWIPATKEDDSTSMFACRMAAISAASLDDWQKAAELFMEGHKRAQIFTWWKVYIAGFLADAGFALWKAGEFANVVPIFKEVLEYLERLPDPEENLDSFTVIKSVEHTLLWIMKMTTDRPIDIDVAEPPPGLCSNPERREHIRELPLTPIALSWAHLAEIEFHLKFKPVVFESAFPRFVKEHDPANKFFLARAQLLLAELDVRYAFRNLQFDNFPAQLHILQTFFQITGKNLLQEKETFADSGINIQINEQVLTNSGFITEALLMALLALVATEQSAPTQLETWRDAVKKTPLQNRLNTWFDFIENMLSLKKNEAIGIMKDGKESNERRLSAILRILIEEHVQPEALFYAHTLLVYTLLHTLFSTLWIHDIADYLAQMIARQWLNTCQCPALLNMPRITVPAIESACKSEQEGLPKIANILLASSDAVSVRLPQDIVEQLRNLALSKN